MVEPIARARSVDPAEVAQFSALAAEFWDPRGKMRMLHRLNPLRLRFIRDHACRHFGREAGHLRCLEGLRMLDIGCGGGLLSEPLARLGAAVVGADPAPSNIEVARPIPALRSIIAPRPPRRSPMRERASTSCWPWKWSSTSPT